MANHGVKMVLVRTLVKEHVYTTPTRERYRDEGEWNLSQGLAQRFSHYYRYRFQAQARAQAQAQAQALAAPEGAP